MQIRGYYQTQPDAYVRFDWHGHKMEGEFFEYYYFGADRDKPKRGYIRPFDKFLRQCLIDNLIVSQEMDAENYFLNSWVIICDALVTDEYIKAPYQSIIENFDFISEDELITDKGEINDCRVDVLKRQYFYAKACNEPEELLNEIHEEFLRWVTPHYKPLRYRRTWYQKHGDKVKTIALLLIAILMLALSR